jgi:hypothetical protein
VSVSIMRLGRSKSGLTELDVRVDESDGDILKPLLFDFQTTALAVLPLVRLDLLTP